MTNLSSFTDLDRNYMTKALALASRGRFTTTPNPNVGCIIVQDQQIVGSGFHIKAGEPHAEVYAIQAAGVQAIGATAYVTLEPCSHFGRTPPCADALIKAGIIRVVVAMEDPNPKVSGQGIQRLRNAGIRVDVGLLSDKAKWINRAFLKRIRTGLSFVQLKLAASLDGKIAMASGESQWITSSEAREDVQVFRAEASAILSTSKTVQMDNASLTVRHHQLPHSVSENYAVHDLRQPIRIILDSHNSLTGDEHLFKQDGDIWVVRKNHQIIDQVNSMILVEGSKDPRINLHELFKLLGDKQINSIWVEAGTTLAGTLIEQDLVDELIIYYAPKILGHNAIDLCQLPRLEKLSFAPEFEFSSVQMIGSDLRCVLHKKRPTQF